MYPRRSLLPVRDSRGMRKAARNNKYLQTLRLKNLRSAVKKKLKNVRKNNRKTILKKCKTVARKPSKNENESQTSSDLIRNYREVESGLAQQAEESLTYNAGNKHTRSVSKRCNEVASIYIPCDYSYELSVRKPWPTNCSSSEFLEKELHQSDKLKQNIRDIMKDSLDLVLGYCFLYVPEENETNQSQNVQRESLLGCQISRNDTLVFCNIQNSKEAVEKFENIVVRSVDVTETPHQHFESDNKNKFKSCFSNSNKLFYRNIINKPDIHFEYPNLPEKCDDLNISEFLIPHLRPGRIKKHTTGNEYNQKLARSSRQREFLLLNNLPTEINNEDLVTIYKEHSYAKVNKELMLSESLLRANTDANYALFVNKESSPKQYRNPKRTFLNNGKEGAFNFGTRSKIKKIDDHKLMKSNENISLYSKQIKSKKFITSEHTSLNSADIKQTDKDCEDRSFLKELVMDTALLYSMLCGVEPEDIAFYIETRPIDPDQWAIDILDSINVH